MASRFRSRATLNGVAYDLRLLSAMLACMVLRLPGGRLASLSCRVSSTSSTPSSSASRCFSFMIFSTVRSRLASSDRSFCSSKTGGTDLIG